MDTEVEDVKAGAESSAAQTPDAQAASSTASATTADSPPQGDKKPDSLSAALDAAKLEMPEETGAGESQESSAEAPPTSETKPGATDQTAAAKDGQAGQPKEGAQGADVPFHTRPEWQSAMKVLAELPDKGAKLKPIIREAFERETRANEQLRAVKPLADVTTELKTIVGGDKEFDTMRQVVRGFANGDPAVLPILKQMVSQMEKVSGEVLTSQDLVQRQAKLQERFNDGLIDQTEFNEQTNLLRETEKARATANQAKTRLQTTQTQQQTQQEQAAVQERVNALNSWENNIRQRDPDFGNVTPVADPKHGESVADQVFDAISLRYMQKPDSTTEEIMAAAQRAYDRARKTVPAPALRQSKVVTSASSSQNARQRPKTMREAMDAVKLE